MALCVGAENKHRISKVVIVFLIGWLGGVVL